MNIGQFREYCSKNFLMETCENEVRDPRKRPVIPAGDVFRLILEMPALGQKSLLAVDEDARSPAFRRSYGCTREIVASDTSIERVLKGMRSSQLRDFSYRTQDRLDEEGLSEFRLSTGKRIRVGVLDGSTFGNFWANVLATSGGVDSVVDLEPYQGRGHELDAGRVLLKRAFGTLGSGYFNIVAADALYMDREDFRLCRELGSHLLVKTEGGEAFNMIKDARSLFFPRDGKIRSEVRQASGTDCARQIEYEIRWAEGFLWRDLECPLTVAHVREKHLKPAKGRPEEVEFWVVTTASGLEGEDLRELAHQRWHIENQVFKRLNALVGSKRCWSKKPAVFERLLRLWMLGMTLLAAWLFQRGWKLAEETWRTLKKTWGWVTRQMRAPLVATTPSG